MFIIKEMLADFQIFIYFEAIVPSKHGLTLPHSQEKQYSTNKKTYKPNFQLRHVH